MLSSNICRANLQSESEKIKEAIDTQTNEIPDARTYLLTLKEIRIKYAYLCAFLLISHVPIILSIWILALNVLGKLLFHG